jgi:DNA polymerase III epsilon subunit family exonuclease
MSTTRALSYAFIDLETTGLDPINDRIIEIAVLIVNIGQRQHFGKSRMINPERKLPQVISELTGISDEDLVSEKIAKDVLPEILDLIGDRIIFAYNAEFDMAFLRAETNRLGLTLQNSSFCIYQQVRKVYPNLISYKLGNVCDALDIHLESKQHRASGDVERAVRVWVMANQSSPVRPEFLRAAVSQSVEIFDVAKNRSFLRCTSVSQEILIKCQINEFINTWDNPTTGDIYLYAPASYAGDGRIAVISRMRSNLIHQYVSEFPNLIINSITGGNLILEGLREHQYLHSPPARLDESDRYFQSKKIISIAVLNICEPSPDDSMLVGRIAVQTARVVLPIGEVIDIEPHFECPFFNAKISETKNPWRIYRTDDQSAHSLENILESIDVVIAHDVSAQTRILSRLLANERLSKPHVWGCTMKMFARRVRNSHLTRNSTVSMKEIFNEYSIPLGEAENPGDFCGGMLNILKKHAGKTSRSRTFAGALILNSNFALSFW